ncbi:MAG: tRNA guanosine(34) transglycosylase Tgt, partial [Deltaproteobacteria bacterium]
LLAYHLNTIHNIHYYIHLVQEMRQAITQNKFPEFKTDFYNKRNQ